MIENFETIVKNSEAIRNLATSMAIVVGGAWAIFTFWAFRLRQKALAEVAVLELSAKRQAALNIELKARQLRLPANRGYYLEVIANVENTGSKNAFLEFPKAPLEVTEVIVDETEARPCSTIYGTMFAWQSIGDLSEDETSDIYQTPSSKTRHEDIGKGRPKHVTRPEFSEYFYVVRVGMRVQFPFVVRVPGPGLYYLDFSVELSKSDLDVMKESTHGRPVEGSTWTDTVFVTVSLCSELEKSLEGVGVDSIFEYLVTAIEKSLVRGWDQVRFHLESLENLEEFREALFELERARHEICFSDVAPDAGLLAEFFEEIGDEYSAQICQDLDIPSLIEIARWVYDSQPSNSADHQGIDS